MTDFPNHFDFEASIQRVREEEFDLFAANIELILKHQNTICARSDYFHTPLAFAGSDVTQRPSSSGTPVTNLSGPFRLGHLILGWQDSRLLDHCPDCAADVLITYLTIMFRGPNMSWEGLCTQCRQMVQGGEQVHHPSIKRSLIRRLRASYPNLEFNNYPRSTPPAFSFKPSPELSPFIWPLQHDLPLPAPTLAELIVILEALQ